MEDFAEFYEEPCQLLLPKLLREKRQFDCALIDGDHRFDGVFVDFFYVHRLLRPGGVVIFDDLWLDAVYLTCRFEETNYGYVVSSELASRSPSGKARYRFHRRNKSRRSQIRAYRKPVEEIYRDWNNFVPFFDLTS